ncbi:hypothetical protein B0H14DRAFT_3480209 [Mycena olivaceomarginata]|nr:hypothetical protein B0H14DRAFT_3480209 [Mycena olivaceomarginata]
MRPENAFLVLYSLCELTSAHKGTPWTKRANCTASARKTLRSVLSKVEKTQHNSCIHNSVAGESALCQNRVQSTLLGVVLVVTDEDAVDEARVARERSANVLLAWTSDERVPAVTRSAFP